MKIAIFASAFHPSLGGVEELVRQLAHALKRAGHEAIILTQRWPRDLPAFEDFEGLRVFRFAFRTDVESGPLVLRVRAGATLRLTRAGIHREIAALLQREGVDLVHVQCVSASAIYAGESARRLNLPLVVTLQGELHMDATQLFQRSPLARQMMRDALQNATAITACSGQTLAEAEQFFGQPFGARGSVIYNGIRLADFESMAPFARARPFILGIGRHVPQKGFDVLLRAYAQMRVELEAKPGATTVPIPDLIIAGDGASGPELKALSRELELEECVDFIGRVDRAGAVSLFKGCDFFVLPSRHEPMGIVNLEAMAAGKAVVASRVGGVPELVEDGQNGILVTPDDPIDLARALGRLVGDKTLSHRLGACGKARARSFDWDIIALRYLKTYSDVLSFLTSAKPQG